MRCLQLVLLLGLATASVCAQSAPPVDSKVVLKVSLASNQREFHIGEIIPLQLSFTSSLKDIYQSNTAQYDRSGRMDYEQFVVSPAQGAVDPMPGHTGGLGGLSGYQFLSPQPWTIKLNLNEWVRFTQPGEYRLTIVSNRLAKRDPASSSGLSAIAARSNEIVLKIVAADPDWQKNVFNDAVKILDKPVPLDQGQTEAHATAREQAVETLRHLGTADAAREMAKRMRGDYTGRLESVCSLGLRTTPERAAARSALQEALADPDHPINGHFLYTLRVVTLDPADTTENWQENQQRVVEQLIAALSTKRGEALTISLNTALVEAWNLSTLPKEITDKLAGQLISVFDQLPVQDQNALLTHRWDKIGGAAMLPILKRRAQLYRDFSEMNDSIVYEARQLSATALKRWYELDPAGARPAFITEITRPRPRFDARVLGILPDETLPEVEFTLAENFTASDELYGSSHIASLIARYATAAILPQIVEKLDPKLGKCACAIQNPVLAYLLRVNPEVARPRIERAIAARGQGFSGCNHALLRDVAEIHYDPILETIAINSLDDPDPQVAGSAATMLGKFGSPAAESALLQRFTKWSATWAGRESQLNRLFSDPIDDKTYQLGLGQSLAHSLAAGQSWLADKNKLQRLSQMTKIRGIQQQVEPFLKHWESEAIPVYVTNGSSPPSFHAILAQYEMHSIKALKEKVNQLPRGTKFDLAISPQDSTADSPAMNELRAFLKAHSTIPPR